MRKKLELYKWSILRKISCLFFPIMSLIMSLILIFVKEDIAAFLGVFVFGPLGLFQFWFYAFSLDKDELYQKKLKKESNEAVKLFFMGIDPY